MLISIYSFLTLYPDHGIHQKHTDSDQTFFKFTNLYSNRRVLRWNGTVDAFSFRPSTRRQVDKVPRRIFLYSLSITAHNPYIRRALFIASKTVLVKLGIQNDGNCKNDKSCTICYDGLKPVIFQDLYALSHIDGHFQISMRHGFPQCSYQLWIN
jgi:hypothetical protein